MRNSVSTRNSALKFRFMRNSAVQMWKSVPILRINTELRIEIPLDAEYWNKFSASCGIPLYVNIYELLWNRMENSPHLTFFVFFIFLLDFHVCGNGVPIPRMRISARNMQKIKIFAEIWGRGVSERKLFTNAQH